MDVPHRRRMALFPRAFPAEMQRIQAEMKAVMQQEKESQAMLLEAFRGIGYGID